MSDIECLRGSVTREIREDYRSRVDRDEFSEIVDRTSADCCSRDEMMSHFDRHARDSDNTISAREATHIIEDGQGRCGLEELDAAFAEEECGCD